MRVYSMVQSGYDSQVMHRSPRSRARADTPKGLQLTCGSLASGCEVPSCS